MVLVIDSSRVDPPYQVVPKGSGTKLYCKSSVPPRWYFKHTMRDPLSIKNPLKVRNLKTKHSGEYFCFGRYEDTEIPFLAKGYIKVYGKKNVNVYKLLIVTTLLKGYITPSFICSSITQSQYC